MNIEELLYMEFESEKLHAIRNILGEKRQELNELVCKITEKRKEIGRAMAELDIYADIANKTNQISYHKKIEKSNYKKEDGIACFKQEVGEYRSKIELLEKEIKIIEVQIKHQESNNIEDTNNEDDSFFYLELIQWHNNSQRHSIIAKHGSNVEKHISYQ